LILKYKNIDTNHNQSAAGKSESGLDASSISLSIGQSMFEKRYGLQRVA
jgi:hypothetical protein